MVSYRYTIDIILNLVYIILLYSDTFYELFNVDKLIVRIIISLDVRVEEDYLI